MYITPWASQINPEYEINNPCLLIISRAIREIIQIMCITKPVSMCYIYIVIVLSSPTTSAELSPGLAALTVGCDSGNLGSLSRVQLLLLDRQEPESLPSPFDPEDGFSPVEDWPDLTTQYDPESAGMNLKTNKTKGTEPKEDVQTQKTNIFIHLLSQLSEIYL